MIQTSGLPKNMQCIGETEVIMATDSRKIKVVDLNTMTVTRVFEGKLCPYGCKMEIIKDGKEILTLTQGKHGFKTYSIETGKTVNLLHAPPEIRESKQNEFDQYSLRINKTMMACHIKEEGPIVIFNYIQNVCVSVLKMNSFSPYCGAYLPQDSSYLAVNTYKRFPDPIIQGKMNSLSCIVVYNIQPGKISHWCLDQDYYHKYAKQGVLGNEDLFVDDAILLDDERLVTSNADCILRVWNIRTGELIKRLEQHRVSPNLVSNHEMSPYFVSMANFGEENSLCLWDKISLTCMATYRLDHKIQKVEFCADGRSLVCMMEDCNVIYWTLVVPGTQSTTLSDFPLTFQGQECDITMEIYNKKDEEPDQFDPDDDDDGTSHDYKEEEKEEEEEEEEDFDEDNFTDDDFADDDDQDNDDFDDEDNNNDTDFLQNEDEDDEDDY